MRIAFDCHGTLLGYRGEVIAEAFKKLQELGHECVVWSNAYGYTTDAVNKHSLKAPTMTKKTRGDIEDYEMGLFDVAIDDDRSQTWLGAKNFVWVDEVTGNSDALVKYILKKAGEPPQKTEYD